MFQPDEGSGNEKQANHRHASNAATWLNAEKAFSEAELLKRAMRFLDLAYLSKRKLVPGTSAISGNLMYMSTVLIVYIAMPVTAPSCYLASCCSAMSCSYRWAASSEFFIMRKRRVRLLYSKTAACSCLSLEK